MGKTSAQKLIFNAIALGSFIALVMMTVMVCVTQLQLSKQDLKSTAEIRIADAKERLEASEKDIAELTDQLSEDYLTKARAFAEMISLDPALVDDADKMERIRGTLDVDELHVIDENGIIKWSTIPEYVGFDMNGSEQTKPFMKCLEDSSYELAQEPQINGAGGILFQYIGVARRDTKGFVQIGMEPVRLTEALKDSQPDVILGNITVGGNGTMFAVNKSDMTVAAFMDSSYIGKFAEEAGITEKILGMGEGKIKSVKINGEKYLACVSETEDYYLGTLIPYGEATNQTVSLTIMITLMTMIVLTSLSVFISRTVKRLLLRPLNGIEDDIRTISAGNADLRLNVRSCQEFDTLSDGFNGMLDGIAQQMAETERLNGSMKNLLQDVFDTSQSIKSYSNEMKEVSDRISGGSTAQASAVQELNAAFTSISKDVSDNAESAEKARKFSESTGEQLKEGAAKMTELRAAMDKITDYSHRIEKIVNTIDDIAFQTNILALNAAVEAARAGVHGKGFAVVADEVRNLANKSAEAAKNTTSLISETLSAVENGNTVANATAEQLTAMTDGIEKSIALIAEISDASAKQALSVNEVTGGMTQIAEVAQSNSAVSANAQETADKLDSEAERLIALVKSKA